MDTLTPPTANPDINTFVDIPTAAAILGITTETMADWVRSRRVTSYRLGNRLIRINTADLLELLTPIPRDPAAVQRAHGRRRKHYTGEGTS